MPSPHVRIRPAHRPGPLAFAFLVMPGIRRRSGRRARGCPPVLSAVPGAGTLPPGPSHGWASSSVCATAPATRPPRVVQRLSGARVWGDDHRTCPPSPRVIWKSFGPSAVLRDAERHLPCVPIPPRLRLFLRVLGRPLLSDVEHLLHAGTDHPLFAVRRLSLGRSLGSGVRSSWRSSRRSGWTRAASPAYSRCTFTTSLIRTRCALIAPLCQKQRPSRPPPALGAPGYTA